MASGKRNAYDFAGVADRIRRAKNAYNAKAGKDLIDADLASRVGISARALSEIRNRERKMALHEVVRFAQVLGVHPCWLAFGDGPMSGGSSGDIAPFYPMTPVPDEAPSVRRVAEGGPGPSRPAIRGGGQSSGPSRQALPRRRPK